MERRSQHFKKELSNDARLLAPTASLRNVPASSMISVGASEGGRRGRQKGLCLREASVSFRGRLQSRASLDIISYLKILLMCVSCVSPHMVSRKDFLSASTIGSLTAAAVHYAQHAHGSGQAREWHRRPETQPKTQKSITG